MVGSFSVSLSFQPSGESPKSNEGFGLERWRARQDAIEVLSESYAKAKQLVFVQIPATASFFQSFQLDCLPSLEKIESIIGVANGGLIAI